MKSKTLGILAALTLSSHAITLTWNGPAGGNWDTATTNWLDNVTPATWNNATPDSAVFGSTGAGTVNLTTGITCAGITFNTAGYTIAGNTLTLSNSTVTANADASISSALAGATGLTKAGSGKLTLGSTPGYTGATTVNNGTLQFPYSAAFASATAINSPGALTLTSTAQIVGSASWTLSGNGPLTIGGTANTRMIPLGSGASYTGDITIKANSVFEPRAMFSSATGNSVTVEPGGNLQLFGSASFNGVNGSGSAIVGSFTAAATLTVGKDNGSGVFSGNMKNNSTVLSLTKIGTGTQELSGANIIYTGDTILTKGTLKLTQTTALGTSKVTMDNANTVNLQLNAPNNGDSWTYAKQILAGASASAMIEKIGSGTVVLNPAAASTFGGTAANAVQVTAGTLYVNAALNATAPKATVNGGTLGGKNSLGDTVVASGGAIEGGQAGTGTLTLNNLTFNGTGGLTVSPAASYVPVVVNNALTVNGTVTVNIANAPALGATYHLMQFTGAPAGGGSFVLPPSRSPYSLTVNGSFLDLVVGSTAVYPVWTGTQSSEWSLNSIAGSKNWKQSTDNAPTDFMALDSVIFNDSATNTVADISVANVSPSSVTFNNSIKNYTLTGSFGIASGTLTKTGSGSLTINNVNTYSGATTVNNGTLSFASGGLGSSAVTFTGNSTLQWQGGNSSSVPLAINSGVTATLDTGANSITEATAVGGTGALTKSGTGTLTLDGSSTLTGSTIVSQGTLQLNSATAAGTGAITLGDANTGSNPVQLTIGNSATGTGLARDITVAADGTGTATIKLADIGTGVSGTGTTTLNRATTIDGSAIANGYYQSSRSFAGTGTLTYAGAAGKRFILTTSSPDFTGDITIQSGLFEPRTALSAVAGNNITVNTGATLNVLFSATSIKGLNGGGSVVQSSGGGPLTIGLSDASGDFSGSVSGPLSVIKTGAGTQVLSGTSSYSGATNVNGGVLQIDGSLSSAVANTSINLGGTLAGSGTISGNVTINGGTLAAGGVTLGNLHIGGSLTLYPDATVSLRIHKTGGILTNDKISMTGATGIDYDGTLHITLDAGSDSLVAGDKFTLFSRAAGTFNYSFAALDLPALGNPALQWDTSSLNFDGSIVVQAVGTVSTPTFDLPGGGYIGEQSVSLSSGTAGAEIRYTTNGSDPTPSSPVYSFPITIPVGSTLTLKAIALKSGMMTSGIASATYSAVETATWTNLAGGSWPVAANWLGEALPNGGPVRFDTLALTGNTTVTLDGTRTVEGITFADANNAAEWTLAPGTSGSLALDSFDTPTITVANQTTTISAPITGFQGLTKAGAGTLKLKGTNTYGGGTTVDAGTLVLNAGDFQNGILHGTATVNQGATLRIDYAGAYFPVKSTDIINLNGGGTLDLIGATTGTNGVSSYAGAVNLTSDANGSASVTSSDASPLRFGRQSSGSITSTGPVTNTYAAPIMLLSGNSTTLTVSADAGNTLSITGAISDFDIYTGQPVQFSGAGTTVLTATSTYAGTTTVNNGTLTVNGSLANSAVTVGATGTLAGTGTLGGAATVNGTVSPGTSVGTFHFGSTVDLATGSTYVAEITSLATHDKLVATGALTANGKLKLVLNGYTPVLNDTFDLADAASITGAPSVDPTSTALPAGLAWDLSSFTTDGTVKVVPATTYNSWADAMGLVGTDRAKSADPDHDGVINLMEFALAGNPLSATDNGVSSAKLRAVSGSPTLTLTLAVRSGATFAPGANNTRVATVDGIIYQIEGSTGLGTWTDIITEVTPVLTDGVPASPPTGWEFHTFRTAGPVATTPKDFIRTKVTEAP